MANDKNRPLISIIVPVYNTGEYISDCIESVLKQTFSDWELILVDDGSADNSLDICRQYALGDDRIKVFHKSNSGQFETRMFGVKNATGRYCTGLDSDDYYDVNCLEVVAEALLKDDPDILVWNLRKVKDGIIADEAIRYSDYRKYTPNEYITEIIESTDNSFCNKAFKNELFEKIDESVFEKEIRVTEDAIMVYQLVLSANAIVSIRDCLYNYRINANSISNSQSGKVLIGAVKACEVLDTYLRKNGIMDDGIERIFAGVHVNIIAQLIKESFKLKTISKEECFQIHELDMYKKIKKYENTKMIKNIDIYVAAKLFRYKMYFWLRLMCNPKRFKK